MRIAIIAPQPYVEIRGTPMATMHMASALADMGHEVRVLTFPFGETPPKHVGVSITRCRRVPSVRSVKIGFSAAKIALDASLLVTSVEAFRRHRFDCIHGVEEGALIGLLAGRRRIPVIYDMDSVMSHDVASSSARRIPGALRLVRAGERWLIRNASLVMTISESMADYVRSIAPSQDVVIVPDIPVLSADKANPERARKQIPLEFANGRKLIMYTGSLAAYQGVDMLVSAMARVTSEVPEAALIIVGGTHAEAERLAGQARSDGAMHNVFFVGKKPPEEIPHFLSAADVLVSPRRSGINPPGKIYSYMQSGKPLVATDIPAHRTIIGEDAAILTPPNVEGLADGISWALRNPDEAARRASRAQDVVRDITPELQMRRIREAYGRVTRKTGVG